MMSVNAADLRIRLYPDATLRRPAEPVENVDDEIRAIVARMIELMKAEKGVGLAAPQVGLPIRVFVTDSPEDGETLVYINPELRLLPGERERREEGCLSIPGVHVEIERPMAATLSAQDLKGHVIEREAHGFTARIWQHEMDHLNGVLILDRMSPLDRLANRKVLKELEAAAET
jgi:peptide deformylase